MSKIKIKIITGFRENQFYSIDADEAHKAYYLFTHPEERGVFENGVALIGKNIQGIEPDWNAIMEYNPDYELDYEDWNELRSTGLERRAKEALVIAKDVARMVEGGIWSGGRHTRGKGYLGDMEKYNTAAKLGFTVLRYSTEQVKSGLAVKEIKQLV